MAEFSYIRTTEPSISSYIDVKTGLRKFRIFITYYEENNTRNNDIVDVDVGVVHKFSKNYKSFSEANRFGNILRDLLELNGISCQESVWDVCRSLSETDLCALVKEFHEEKVAISKTRHPSPLLDLQDCVCFNESNSNYEEVERSVEWWDVNKATFLRNKEVADEISASVMINSQFAMLSPKLYSNYMRLQKTDFFKNMCDYIDPSSKEAYFTFKTDLMSGIFTVEEIIACKKQFLDTLSEPSLNGVYMSVGMRRMITNLNV